MWGEGRDAARPTACTVVTCPLRPSRSSPSQPGPQSKTRRCGDAPRKASNSRLASTLSARGTIQAADHEAIAPLSVVVSNGGGPEGAGSIAATATAAVGRHFIIACRRLRFGIPMNDADAASPSTEMASFYRRAGSGGMANHIFLESLHPRATSR